MNFNQNEAESFNPFAYTSQSDDGYQEGMTLLDYFAGQIMANPVYAESLQDFRDVYKIAHEMLDVRQEYLSKIKEMQKEARNASKD